MHTQMFVVGYFGQDAAHFFTGEKTCVLPAPSLLHHVARNDPEIPILPSSPPSDSPDSTP